MTKNLTIKEDSAPKKRRDPIMAKLEELERRLEHAEHIARNYESMYGQIEAKLKALADRHGNIQAVYDYMVKVGSTIVTKKLDNVAFLNPNDDPLRLKDE